MKRLLAPLMAAICGMGLLAGAEARAAILWTYDWTPGTSNVISDSGLNQITMSNQPLFTASGDSDIVATNINVKAPVVGAFDSFTAQNYSLVMKLTDLASGASTLLTFSGSFTGTITPTSSNIDTTFNLPNVQSVVLGDNEYTVTLGPYTPPGPAGSNPGSIGAHVDVRPTNGGEPPNDVPEPSTMVLSCLGLAGLGLNAWRKRKMARA